MVIEIRVLKFLNLILKMGKLHRHSFVIGILLTANEAIVIPSQILDIDIIILYIYCTFSFILPIIY